MYPTAPPTLLNRRQWLACVGSGSAACLLGRVSAAGDDPPVPAGLRVFTCGHSFHVWVVRMLEDLAGTAGIKDHRIAGVSSIGGSRVIQHWDVPEETNAARKALSAGEVDVLTLSPIWLPDEGIEHFARLAIAHNPDIRITVQEFWLPNDTYNPVYPLETRKKVDHNATDITELREQQNRYRQDLENHLRELNQRLNTQALCIVPAGAATVALREQIVTTRVPGLKVQWRLFADDWGHPTPPLKVLAAYCHFAVIYRRSPVGLPLPLLFEQNQEFKNPQLNQLLQELAWQAVTENPLTGVSATL
jgi:hypothetical protein